MTPSQRQSKWMPTKKELGQLQRLYGGSQDMKLLKGGGVMLPKRKGA